MVALYVLGALSVCVALGSGFCNIRHKSRGRIICKTVASLLFVALAIVALALSGHFSKYGILVLAALILGMLGDIFLCTDGLATPDAKQFFDLMGAVCFGAGHVFFIAIFLSLTSFNWYLLPCIIVLPAAFIVATKVLKFNLGKLKLGAPIYATMLGLMLVSTINLYVNTRSLLGILSMVAGILFVISDFSLLLKEYSRFKGNRYLIYIVLITYYIAQSIFAYTVIL